VSSDIRHREVSRLEGFSDAVFGFALTLLVVSLDTPKDFEGLKALVAGFLPFALMFAMVCWIWYQHNVFFRRYGLQDAWTAFLNAVLLFVVLFYVYPLRFLTLALVGGLTMEKGTYPDIRDADGTMLMTLYSVGVLLIFSVFLLLHWHAWRKRVELDLDAFEQMVLKFSARGHALSAGIAVVSLVLVAALPTQPAWGGIIYSMMGPAHGWNGYKAGRARDRFAKTTSI